MLVVPLFELNGYTAGVVAVRKLLLGSALAELQQRICKGPEAFNLYCHLIF